VDQTLYFTQFRQIFGLILDDPFVVLIPDLSQHYQSNVECIGNPCSILQKILG